MNIKTMQIRKYLSQNLLFDGKLSIYNQRKEAFIKAVKRATNAEKMIHLLGHTKDQPKMLLEGLQVNDKTYKYAWESLDKEYNKKRTLLYNNLQKTFFKENATKIHDVNSYLKWNSAV